MLEACLALALIAIALVATLHSFSQTVLMMERARETSLAVRLLDEQALYASVRGGVNPHGEEGTSETPAWPWTVTAAPVDDTTSQLLAAQFSVHWSHRGRPQHLDATTWLPPRE